MKKALTICSVLLVLASLAAFAEDNRGAVTINGGRNTVATRGHVQHTRIINPAVNPFYDNIGTGGYNCCSGWTVSDGSPIGTEYTPANNFVSLKSGVVHSVSVGYGFVTGTNGGKVTLDKDCSGIPCGTIDKTNICRGSVSNLPTFGGSSSQVVTIKCKGKKKLKKGSTYWVYVETPDNTWNAWNLSNSASLDFVEGTNDVWGTPGAGSTAAMTIK
jgi:hypothetical protein